MLYKPTYPRRAHIANRALATRAAAACAADPGRGVIRTLATRDRRRATTLRARPPPRPPKGPAFLFIKLPPPPPRPAWRATRHSHIARTTPNRAAPSPLPFWHRPPSPRRNPRRRSSVPPLPRRACAATEPRWCSRMSAAAPPRAGPTPPWAGPTPPARRRRAAAPRGSGNASDDTALRQVARHQRPH